MRLLNKHTVLHNSQCEVHVKLTPITSCYTHPHLLHTELLTFLCAKKFKKYSDPKNTIRQHTTTSKLRFTFSKNNRYSFSNSLFVNFNLRMPNLHSLSPSSSTSSVSAIPGCFNSTMSIIPTSVPPHGDLNSETTSYEFWYAWRT